MLPSLQSMPNRKTRKLPQPYWPVLYIHRNISIMKDDLSIITDFRRHFNNMRSYVMGNESGLLMASWPKGRLEVPFPYFAKVMTGFGIQSVRDRHDGAKRNPFSEPECGHHYARSMASWSAIIALSDFQYSGVDKSMKITDRPGNYFWSNGYAWGTIQVTDNDVTIEVINGSLLLKSLTVGNKKEMKLKNFDLKEDFCPGIAGLKAEMKQVLSSSEIINIEHDQLIARLDSISNLFEVVIIKTGLTKPYTSTFFELDCKYWDNSKQSILNGRIADAKQSK